MIEAILRTILAYKRRVIKSIKKRPQKQKLKARTYYRKHKRQILLTRKRYLQKNKPFLSARKSHKRAKPAWQKKQQAMANKIKPKVIKPKSHPAPKPKAVSHKPKVFKPKLLKPKIHAPKRIH